jgi:hypothetical protein
MTNIFSIKNNTVFSQASNLERDGANFSFASIDFVQRNTASTTTLERKAVSMINGVIT